ncbi:hypothetical protein MOD24_16965 [Bacillus haynesii]|uniref:hypothetical protein n=1 Tax=Bacillus haynesii TaxID=1925021 RepID=UPI00228228EB|nr:hypothetical protein [Bacillus haynesii]MCY8577537.1 hypothetical protein [Bacillus haynesii]MEC1657116.1 hypothetical protein [Bacillus haynesii]
MTISIQLFCGAKAPQKSLIQPIKNQIEILKAQGGIWTSTYNEEFGSEWLTFYNTVFGIPEEGLNGWLLTPSPTARVYTIDSYDDLNRLFKSYELKITGVPNIIKMLDFEKMTEDFDAIHLTTQGKTETRLSHPFKLHTWDCECTHWFKWCFDKVEPIGKIKGFK